MEAGIAVAEAKSALDGTGDELAAPLSSKASETDGQSVRGSVVAGGGGGGGGAAVVPEGATLIGSLPPATGTNTTGVPFMILDTPAAADGVVTALILKLSRAKVRAHAFAHAVICICECCPVCCRCARMSVCCRVCDHVYIRMLVLMCVPVSCSCAYLQPAGPAFEARVYTVTEAGGTIRATLRRKQAFRVDLDRLEVDQLCPLTPPMAVARGEFLAIMSLTGKIGAVSQVRASGAAAWSACMCVCVWGGVLLCVRACVLCRIPHKNPHYARRTPARRTARTSCKRLRRAMWAAPWW